MKSREALLKGANCLYNLTLMMTDNGQVFTNNNARGRALRLTSVLY